MSWEGVSMVCVALASGYATLALATETEPFINEDGEEDYSTKGYIVIGVALLVRWGVSKLMRLLGYKKRVVILEEAKDLTGVKEVKYTNEYELDV